jgi:ABC-type Fe3+-siderophore transport system permease subunit
MTQSAALATAEAPVVTSGTVRGHGRAALLALGGLTTLTLLAMVHLTQGTAAVGPADVWQVVFGQSTDQAASVVMLSRLPRMFAAVLVGVALGVAGAILQGVARNPLASPDTLAVEAGAFFALTAVAAFTLDLPVLSGGGVAFAGGLLAAGAVMLVAGGGGTSTVRLILGGSVIALGLGSLTAALMLFFTQETRGLYAWGAGSLSQRDLDGIATMAPVVAIGLTAAMLMSRRMDLLALGDDAAASLGMSVTRSKTALVVVAVLLSAASVTVAGPVGFIGLCAPAVVRLASRWAPELNRAAWRLPLAGLAGVVLVLGSDVALRVVLGPLDGVEIPTGVVTTIIGAVFLVAIARGVESTRMLGDADTFQHRPPWGRSHTSTVLVISALLLLGLVVASLLLGDARLLLGDLWNYLTGQASTRIDLILDTRLPRIVAAMLAGAALALAGAVIQGTTRNPLADPGILGVSAGAGLGAIITITFVDNATFVDLLVGAGVGGLLTATLLMVLAARDGLDQMRVILVGIGLAAGVAAITALIIVQSDPWNQVKAITWLGGSTYGATLKYQMPLLIVLVLAVLILSPRSKDLDVLQLDDDSPRLLGVDVGRSRLVLLVTAVLLTAAATASVGVIAFVGLVAPHAARMMVGSVHQRLLPLSALLGAGLVLLADTIGRTVVAPNQLPAGLVTALIGAPYFLWLMHRRQVRT